MWATDVASPAKPTPHRTASRPRRCTRARRSRSSAGVPTRTTPPPSLWATLSEMDTPMSCASPATASAPPS
eukprot:2890803-Prymnesium_polylepis.1